MANKTQANLRSYKRFSVLSCIQLSDYFKPLEMAVIVFILIFEGDLRGRFSG